MKNLFALLLFLGTALPSFSQSIMLDKQLDPCPNSPNCVSTKAEKRSKKMEPLAYSGSLSVATQKLEALLATYPEAKLIEKDDNYLHYEFTTKLGKFIDDVEFLVDEETKHIHFRSASRKGFGDFGKNKRRMKGIRKGWLSE